MATSALNKYNDFTNQLGRGTHNFAANAFKVALTNTAPAATHVGLSEIVEIAAGGGYVAGGFLLDSVTWSTASGVAKLAIADETFTATGTVAQFRYGVIYNDTSTGKNLIGWVDYGAAVNMANGEQFVFDFSASNGVLTVT